MFSPDKCEAKKRCSDIDREEQCGSVYSHCVWSVRHNACVDDTQAQHPRSSQLYTIPHFRKRSRSIGKRSTMVPLYYNGTRVGKVLPILKVNKKFNMIRRGYPTRYTLNYVDKRLTNKDALRGLSSKRKALLETNELHKIRSNGNHGLFHSGKLIGYLPRYIRPSPGDGRHCVIHRKGKGYDIRFSL